MHQAAALETVELLNPSHDVGLVEFEVPELESPAHMGAAVAIVYRDEDGREWMHDFAPGAQLLVDDGIAVVIDTHLSVDDLGLEEAEED